jgi:hypothetical protein
MPMPAGLVVGIWDAVRVDQRTWPFDPNGIMKHRLTHEGFNIMHVRVN